MVDQRQAELRRWIQEVSASSEPVELDDILGRPPVDLRLGPSDETTLKEPTFIHDFAQEPPTKTKRTTLILTVAAALAAVVAFALLRPGSGSSTGTDIADDPEPPTATAQPTGETAVQTATAFWEALAASDRETAIELVDPALVDSSLVAAFGRADTLSAQFDWYEAVGWEWQLNDCVATDDDTMAECSATAQNSWSNALGVEPVTGIFTVSVGEDGITNIGDRDANFFDPWTRLVFNPFQRWVADNHPDDHAIMFDFNVDINPEILRVYERNTTRFVEAQQDQ